MTVYLCKKINGAKFVDNCIIESKIYNKKLYRKFSLDKISSHCKTIGILNLMPNKVETETHLLALFSKMNEDINIKFIRLKTHVYKNCNRLYLMKNYYTFDEVKYDLDGLIVTGAPIEKIDFKQVKYIGELNDIFEYSIKNLKSMLSIRWGAQACLNHIYGINKEILDKKIFGGYKHNILCDDEILKNINNGFICAHSRHTILNRKDLKNCQSIKILSTTYEGIEHIIKGKYNDYYIFGHHEYDKECLKREYIRDRNKKIYIDIPKNYFIEDDMNKGISVDWMEHSIKIYNNWINII